MMRLLTKAKQTRTMARNGISAPRHFLEPVLYLLPFLVGLAAFTVYPFVNAFVISLKENYNLMSGSFSAIGLDNYAKIFGDPNFINGMKNTGIYVVTVVPITTALALLVAVL